MHPVRQLDDILQARPEDRLGKPISVFTGPDGVAVTLSRYGDSIIDLSPYLESPLAVRRINLKVYPERWRSTVLDLLLAYWRHGLPGFGPPKATTVVTKAGHLSPFVQWVDAKGISRFSEVRPIHLQLFAKFLRETTVGKNVKRRRSPQSMTQFLSSVSLAWHLRAHLEDALPTAPFGEFGSPGRCVGVTACEQKKLVTQPLTPEQASKLFKACADLIESSEIALAEQNEIDALRAKLAPDTDKKTFEWFCASELPHLKGRHRSISKQLTHARAACFCLIGLLAGLRIHEIMLLEVGCYFETEQGSQHLGWLRGRTLKTRPQGDDHAEWIAPPIIGKVIALMERLSARARASLGVEIGRIESVLGRKSPTEESNAKLLNRLRSAREQTHRLFLIRHRRGKRDVERAFTAGRESIFWGLRTISERAGLPDYFTAHQLQRTYALMVVNHCAGDLRFLRVQFQHWSIETTLLYAQHDGRDQELVDELAEAMLEYKTGLIASWLNPDTRLGAPGGRYIAAQRSKLSFKGTIRNDHKDLAQSIAPGLVIRPTGHSWCVSTGEPTCGGAGLYDATFCSNCDSAVVGDQHRTIWELLAAQLIDATQLGDAGPGAEQLLERSLVSIDGILRALGSSVEKVRTQHGA